MRVARARQAGVRSNLLSAGSWLNAARQGLLRAFKNIGYYYVENHKPHIAARTYLQGFQTTRDAKMILQAGAAFIPVGLRKRLRRLVKGTPPPVGRQRGC